ncbi:MAG: hypothetical protein ACREA9_24680 [Pyrinomonadaceae bacterium]
MASQAVTDVGVGLDTDIFDGTVAVPANYFIAWGDGDTVGGATAAAVSDTVLQSEQAETGGGRVAATVSQPTAKKTRFVAVLTAGAGQVGLLITEAGVFDQDQPGGKLVARYTFAPVLLALNDTITFTLDVARSN